MVRLGLKLLVSEFLPALVYGAELEVERNDASCKEHHLLNDRLKYGFDIFTYTFSQLGH